MRYSRIYLTIIAIMAILAPTASAQSDATLAQYYAVPSYYNAGAIGTSDFLEIRGGARLQWIGIDNAPQTFLASANMPFKLFNKRFGVGLLFQSESFGLYKSTQLGAQVAYKQKLFKGELSIGVQLGFIDEKFKGTEVFIPGDDDYHQTTDDAIPNSDIGGTAFDMGVGIYYTHKYWWAGLSCTHVTSPTITLNSQSGAGTQEQDYEFQTGRVLYLMVGGNIPIKNTLFEVMPSAMARTDFQFWTAEATARVRYNKFLTLGVGYRYNDAIMATVAAEFKGVFLGYAYEYPLNALSKATSGSHEIMAGYRLKLNLGEKNKNKHKSIRIM